MCVCVCAENTIRRNSLTSRRREMSKRERSKRTNTVVSQKEDRAFDIVVLNRNSPTNFVHALDETVQVKIMEKLLMFKKGEQVHGLYFHDTGER